MRSAEIFKAVMENRQLTETSSLPVVVENRDELEVVWFTYKYEKKEQGGTVRVRAVYSTADCEEIEEQEAELEEPVNQTDTNVPEMSMRDYYAELEKLYDGFDRTAMDRLLEKAAVHALLPVYRAVISFHLNQQETEEPVRLEEEEPVLREELYENSRRRQ